MNAKSGNLQGLLGDMSEAWPRLDLPPVTDWDLFEVLLEAVQEGCGDARSCQAARAALLAARSKLALAGNAELADRFVRDIDRQITRLKQSA